MMIYSVYKKNRRVKGTVQLPTSKSISNRLLMIRAISGKIFPIENLSTADDTLLLQNHLETIEREKGRSEEVVLDAKNAGTVLRFLTAYLACKPGKWVMTGSDRMMERPIGILIDALRKLGAGIEYLSTPGFPPFRIEGKYLTGDKLEIDASVSSQYLSALLMIAPSLPEGLELRLTGNPVSMPYVAMTLGLMESYGIWVKHQGSVITVDHGEYLEANFRVEADWSSAAFWYETAALADEAQLYLPGLQAKSLQGDAIVARIFRELGIESDFDKKGLRLTKKPVTSHLHPPKPWQRRESPVTSHNFSNHPDIAPAVITAFAALGIGGRFTGLEGLKFKESDRYEALAKELNRIGLSISKTGNRTGLVVEGNAFNENEHDPEMVIKSYDDHRLAMAFAPLALKLRHLRIDSPEVVSKSYPGFWGDMEQVGFDIFEK